MTERVNNRRSTGSTALRSHQHQTHSGWLKGEAATKVARERRGRAVAKLLLADQRHRARVQSLTCFHSHVKVRPGAL
jgi:hypothetical protein